MSALPNPAPTANADKERLLALLRDSRENFLGSFALISDRQSRAKAEGCWSVLDTVEHLTVAETTMLRIITTAQRPKSPELTNREEIFLARAADRSRKMEAPERSRPTGRFADLSQAAAHFTEARDKVIEFVAASTDDLRATEVTHPHPAAGVVTTYEMIIIMAKHAERHALQIEEIRNTPAFRACATGNS
jgi:hypothetical protein